MNDPTEGLQDAFRSKSFDQLNQQQWETKVVTLLLSRFGLAGYKRQLYELEQRERGERRLSLWSFAEIFPTFPFYLESKYVSGTSEKMSLKNILDGFERTKYFAMFTEIRDTPCELKGNRCVGLVLPLAHLEGGLLLHNAPQQPDRPGTRVVCVYPEGHITAEPFVPVLRHLMWSP